MHVKKSLLIFSSIVLLTFAAIRCTNNSDKDKTTAHNLGDSVITPVALPAVVPGFHFPEDSNNIYKWLTPYDSASVYSHAWGVWAGLTAFSGEVFQGDSLLVYQTWLGIGEIQTIVANGGASAKKLFTKRSRTQLTFPNQTKHAISLNKLSFASLKGSGNIDTSAGFDFGTNFWVAVAYDPNAADHVINNSLLKQSVLNSYQKDGAIGNIPPFPNNAITTKPVYYVGHKKDSLIRIAAWPGPPNEPRGFAPPKAWQSYVYADVSNQQTPGKQLVPVTTDNPTPSQIAAATCNLNDFIHYSIDSAAAAYFNQQQNAVQNDTAKAGDIALLVAMHVTTKEISNWTWQTFYWSPNPGTPMSPSSNLAASLRPSQLNGAASHYALSTAYAMVIPNQPIYGGTDQGASPMIGYNPYLEAGFTPKTFIRYLNTFKPLFVYGIQTNCMSCHALATPQSVDKAGNPTYSTDQYINMGSPFFKGKVQLDFAWSIQAAIINDTAAKTKTPK